MEKMIRTDLAVEQRELIRGSAEETTELPGVRVTENDRKGFKVTVVDVLDKDGEKALCKPIGRYTTIELDKLINRAENSFEDAAELLADSLRELLRPDLGAGTLVAGLGNAAITPDALGPLAIESVMATRHLKEKMPEEFSSFRPVAAVRTGVLGSTGIESADVLKAVCNAVSPSRVVAVDALASGSLKRLCRTIQLTDAGIVPGSGVGNNRAELCERTLGVPVVAIGVPTVVDAASFSDNENAKGMFVTPRDIDTTVRDTAKLIGYGINLAMHDGLTIGDIDMFLS